MWVAMTNHVNAVKKRIIYILLSDNFVRTDLTDQLIGKGRYTSYSWANHPLSFSHLHSLSLYLRVRVMTLNLCTKDRLLTR